jgi:outer membrane protein
MEKYPFVLNRPALAFCFGLLITHSVPSAADTVFGIYAGAGTWQQEFSGDFRSGITDIDIDEDLGIDDEMNNVFYIAVEHPVPLLPNLRLNYVKFEVTGQSTLTRTIDFNGIIFNLDEDVATDLEVTQGDAVLYYELLDNYVSLDIGIAARYMDGYVELISDSTLSKAEFTAVIPMLYGRARADLPFSGLWIGAEVMGSGYDGNQLIDANAQIGWESPMGLGAEVGYRLLDFDIKDLDDVDEAGIDVAGPYFALNFHF